MPGTAYEITGGPCHWDLLMRFFVVIGPKLARQRGVLDGNGNINEGRLNAVSRDLVERLGRAFHKFWNPKWDPKKGQGDWKLYEFGPCCGFHIDAKFEVAPASLRGVETKEDVRRQLPEGTGLIQIENLGMTEHPHADLHGKIVVMDPDDIIDGTFEHELGHTLGLPDHYKHDHNPMTPQEEARHRGHLMGKKKPRTLDPHEIADIAAHAGMTCDRDICCPGARVRVPRERGDRRELRQTACLHDPVRGAVLEVSVERIERERT